MDFELREEVIYEGKKGIITFVSDYYVVVTLPATPGRDYPRVCVHPQFQHQITKFDNSYK